MITRPGRSLRRVLTLAVAGLVAAAGCAVGPSARPPVAVRGESMPPSPSATEPPPRPPALPAPDPMQPTIDFDDCTAAVLRDLSVPIPPDRQLRVECGELAVPTDPQERGLGRGRVEVLRISPEGASADRPPLLALGDTAVQPSALHALTIATQVPRELLDSYTLVGLDRRGAGADALDCSSPSARAALLDADPVDLSDADLTRLLEDARAVVQDCYLLHSGGLSGYRTASTAADVEQLRGALGVARLSAVGVGDGATALARWAAQFPQSVGRLVLDGPLDPVRDEPERSEATAGAVEAAFDAFAVACTAPGGCPLGNEPRAAVLDLVDQLRDRPVAAVDGRRLTAGGAVTALVTALSEPRDWPALAAALAAPRAGDPAGMLALLSPVVGPDGRFDTTLATACNDSARRLAPAEVAELAARWQAQYPIAGGRLALRLLACAPWPAGGGPASAAPTAPAPPLLVIGVARDPRGPLDGARRVADTIPTSVFVSWQGAGTGAYPRTPCISTAVDRMLIDGVLPAPGTLCPP